MRNKILGFIALFSLTSCTTNTVVKEKWTTKKAPEVFVARLMTTKGNIDIEVERKLSPNAADRFYQLVKYDFFKDGTFYRVVPNFVAQFGNTDTVIANQWKKYKVLDEPVINGNKKGTLSFARYGKDTRELDLFINLNHNARLDTASYDGAVGFPTFGNVINDMDVVNSLYNDYGEATMKEDEIYNSTAAMRSKFPKLDVIKKAKIIKKSK